MSFEGNVGGRERSGRFVLMGLLKRSGSPWILMFTGLDGRGGCVGGRK